MRILSLLLLLAALTGCASTSKVMVGQTRAPITPDQVIQARRPEDLGHSLWTVYQRTQENLTQGGLPGRSALGRRMRTRAIGSIDRDVSLNRALWTLAEQMRRLMD